MNSVSVSQTCLKMCKIRCSDQMTRFYMNFRQNVNVIQHSFCIFNFCFGKSLFYMYIFKVVFPNALSATWDKLSYCLINKDLCW